MTVGIETDIKTILQKLFKYNHQLVWEKIDATQYHLVYDFFQRYHPIDCIYNMASKKSVSESQIHALDYYQNNLIIHMNLLKICQKSLVLI